MSALTAASGEPQSVGDPGVWPPTEFVELIAATVDNVRGLALYEVLRQRLIRTIVSPPFGAGNEIILTPPVGAVWEVLAQRSLFTASAAVASRRPNLRILDVDGNIVYHFDGTNTVTASNASTSTWTVGAGQNQAVSVVQMTLPTPPPIVPPGGSLRSQTTALDVGDTYTQVVTTVREWSVGSVYWAADLIGRELGFEHLTDLPGDTPLPVGTGQPIPVSPLAR